MSLPLVFQAGVRDEIDEAYRWYERQREGLGESFLDAVQIVLDQLQRDPERHAPVFQDVRHSRLKRFPYAVYTGSTPTASWSLRSTTAAETLGTGNPELDLQNRHRGDGCQFRSGYVLIVSQRMAATVLKAIRGSQAATIGPSTPLLPRNWATFKVA